MEADLYQKFLSRLSAVLNGTTNYSENYQPSDQYDPQQHEYVASLTDPVTKELYKYSSWLADESRSLRLPTIGTDYCTEDQRMVSLVLARQSDTVMQLFWESLRSVMLEGETLESENYFVSTGWIVCSYKKVPIKEVPMEGAPSILDLWFPNE